MINIGFFYLHISKFHIKPSDDRENYQRNQKSICINQAGRNWNQIEIICETILLPK